MAILIGRTAQENDELLRNRYGAPISGCMPAIGRAHMSSSRDERARASLWKCCSTPAMLAIYYSKGRSNGGGNLYYTSVEIPEAGQGRPKGLVLPAHEKNLAVRIAEPRIRELRALMGGGRIKKSASRSQWARVARAAILALLARTVMPSSLRSTTAVCPGEVPLEYQRGQRVLDFGLDDSSHGPRPVGRIVALLGEIGLSGFLHLESDAPLSQAPESSATSSSSTWRASPLSRGLKTTISSTRLTNSGLKRRFSSASAEPFISDR